MVALAVLRSRDALSILGGGFSPCDLDAHSILGGEYALCAELNFSIKKHRLLKDDVFLVFFYINYCMLIKLISTRRFCSLPAAVALDAIGLEEPKPAA